MRGDLGKKSFDFWLPDVGVLIEVDGAQHTDTAIRRKAACQQMQRDLLYTRAAIEAGYILVRLHEWDVAHWQSTVQAALHEAAELAAVQADAAEVEAAAVREAHMRGSSTLGMAARGREVTTQGRGRVSRFLHLTPHYFGEAGWLDAWLTSHGPSVLPGGPGCL